MWAVKLPSVRSSWRIKCPTLSCKHLHHPHTIAWKWCGCVCWHFGPGALWTFVPAFVEPGGPNDGSRVGASHICTHSRRLRQSRRRKEGGGNWPVCADGFQPWHVTQLSPAVVLTFEPAVALVPLVPGGDVLRDSWGVRGQSGLFALVLSALPDSLLLFDARSNECQSDFARLLFSWAMQSSCLGVTI